MLFMVLLPFILLFTSFADAISISESEAVPNFTLPSVTGKPVSLDEFSGTVIILLYWQPAQERSLMALRDGQDIFGRYREKRVQVVSVTPESGSRDELIKLIRDHALEFPVLLDSDRRVFGDYGIRVYPTTLIIDRNFRLAYALPGHSPAYKTVLEAHLQHVLGEIDEKKMQDLLTFRKETLDESLAAAERRYNLALKFTETQLYDQAIDAVTKSIEAKPGLAKSHVLLGFLLLVMNENDRAYEEFRKAVGIEPAHGDAKTGLGAALINKGEISNALEVLHDAETSNPCPIRTYYELGRAYELHGDKDASLQMYRKSLEATLRGHIVPSSIAEEYR